VPVGTITSVTASAGSLTQTALVRPVVNFTALGVVGVVVEVPAHNPRVSVLPRPAPTVTVTTTPHPATSSTLAPQVYPSSSGLPAGTSPAPSASRSAGG
jgi:rod shape-determining protein MreC